MKLAITSYTALISGVAFGGSLGLNEQCTRRLLAKEKCASGFRCWVPPGFNILNKFGRCKAEKGSECLIDPDCDNKRLRCYEGICTSSSKVPKYQPLVFTVTTSSLDTTSLVPEVTNLSEPRTVSYNANDTLIGTGSEDSNNTISSESSLPALESTEEGSLDEALPLEVEIPSGTDEDNLDALPLNDRVTTSTDSQPTDSELNSATLESNTTTEPVITNNTSVISEETISPDPDPLLEPELGDLM